MQRRDLTRARSYPGQLNIPQDLTIIGFQHHMDRLEKIFFPGSAPSHLKTKIFKCSI